MDYSLIVGIHDCERGEQEAAEGDQQGEVEEEYSDTENGLDENNETEAVKMVPTPPDSPQPNFFSPFTGEIDPDLERYGIKCSESK